MAKTWTRQEFVSEFSPYVNGITKGTGIFPGTLFAQAILESSRDGRVGASGLSQEANNFFGIKADKGWKGKVYNAKTREVYGGKDTYIKDDFRKYDSVKDSLKDYVSFLQLNPRYAKAGVFNAKSVEEQAEALKRAGYATDPKYASIVSSVYNSIKGAISTSVEKAKTNPLPTALIVTLLAVSVYALIKTLKNKT